MQSHYSRHYFSNAISKGLKSHPNVSTWLTTSLTQCVNNIGLHSWNKLLWSSWKLSAIGSMQGMLQIYSNDQLQHHAWPITFTTLAVVRQPLARGLHLLEEWLKQLNPKFFLHSFLQNASKDSCSCSQTTACCLKPESTVQIAPTPYKTSKTHSHENLSLWIGEGLRFRFTLSQLGLQELPNHAHGDQWPMSQPSGKGTMASPLQPTNAPITKKLALSFRTASGQGSTDVILLASTLMMPDGVLWIWTPTNCKTWNMHRMSCKSGILLRQSSCSEHKTPARTAKLEFLAPLIFTSPQSILPPVISNHSTKGPILREEFLWPDKVWDPGSKTEAPNSTRVVVDWDGVKLGELLRTVSTVNLVSAHSPSWSLSHFYQCPKLRSTPSHVPGTWTVLAAANASIFSFRCVSDAGAGVAIVCVAHM